jgi:hypothetical protein
MATPQLTADQIIQVSGLLAQFITNHREKYAERATTLISAQQKTVMSGFFTPAVLESARLLVLQGERFPNPEFYALLHGLGFKNLPDQSGMAAITLGDVVVSHEPFSNGLLFHELVHVEQYRQLGIPRFSELYVGGFLQGGSYEAIPLEVNAYALEERFRRNPHQIFSVQAEVAKNLEAGKL